MFPERVVTTCALWVALLVVVGAAAAGCTSVASVVANGTPTCSTLSACSSGGCNSDAACAQCITAGCNSDVWPSTCTSSQQVACGTGTKPDYLKGLSDADRAGGLDADYVCYHESLRLCAYVPLGRQGGGMCHHCSNTDTGVRISAGVDLGKMSPAGVSAWFASGGPLQSSQDLKPSFEQYRGRLKDCAVDALCRCPVRQLSSTEARAVFNTAVQDTAVRYASVYNAHNPTVRFEDEKKCVRTALTDYAYCFGVDGIPTTTRLAALRDQGNNLGLLLQHLKDSQQWTQPQGVTSSDPKTRLEENMRVMELCVSSEQQGTGSCAPNVLFVVDASGSVGSYNFGLTLATIQKIAAALPDAAYALVRFASSPTLIVAFSANMALTAFHQTVGSLFYTGGTTDTAAAVDMAVLEFAKVANDRTKVMIVLTDGYSNYASLTIAAAQRAKDKGITTFAIGIGSGPSSSELLALAGGVAANVFLSQSFNDLQLLNAQVASVACVARGQLTPQPDGKATGTTTTALERGYTLYYTARFPIGTRCALPKVEMRMELERGAFLVAMSFSGNSANAYNSEVYGVLETSGRAVISVPGTATFSTFFLPNGTGIRTTTVDVSVTGWGDVRNEGTIGLEECACGCLEGVFGATPSASGTDTVTMTWTTTESVSSSAMTTDSVSPSNTESETSSRSLTATVSASSSATTTESVSPSNTESETSSHSLTATVSASSSATTTESVSLSDTESETSSHSLTATVSASSSATTTETLSVTGTPSGSPTRSGSSSPSASGSETLTPTSSETASNNASTTTASDSLVRSNSTTVTASRTVPVPICNATGLNRTTTYAALVDVINGTLNCSNMDPNIPYRLDVGYHAGGEAVLVQRTVPYGTHFGPYVEANFSVEAPFTVTNESVAGITMFGSLTYAGREHAKVLWTVRVAMPDADGAMALLLNRTLTDTGGAAETVLLLASIAGEVSAPNELANGTGRLLGNVSTQAFAAASDSEQQQLVRSVVTLLSKLASIVVPSGAASLLLTAASAASSLTAAACTWAFEAVAAVDMRQRSVGAGASGLNDTASVATTFVNRIGALLPDNTTQSLSMGNFSASFTRIPLDAMGGQRLTTSSGCNASLPSGLSLVGTGGSGASVAFTLLSSPQDADDAALASPLQLHIHMFQTVPGDVNTSDLSAPIVFGIPGDEAHQRCVYLDTETGTWREVRFVAYGGGATLCSTSHLTTFRTEVPTAGAASSSGSKVVVIAAVCGSVCGCILVAVVVAVVWKRRHPPSTS